MVKLNGGSKNYKKHRMDFPTLQDFICWYNNRPHGSHDLQTPEQEYSGKEPQAHLLGGFFKWTEKQN